MAFKITTVGTQDPVVFDDLGARSFAHPTVDYDLELEFDPDEIEISADIQAAIDAGHITVKDKNDNPINNVEEAGPLRKEDFDQNADSLLDYTADTPANWGSPEPTSLKAALEELATRAQGQEDDADLYDACVDAAGNGDYTLISDAIAGGAKSIFVKVGTYTETVDIVLGDKFTLVGERAGETIINLSGSVSVKADGSGGTKESTGTISVTNSSTAVVGSGTTFTNLSPGDYILIGASFLKIDSITNDTNLVLDADYEGDTKSGLSFVAQNMHSGIRISNLTIANSTIEGLYMRACRHFFLDNILVYLCGGGTTDNIEMVDCGSSRIIGIASESSTLGSGIEFTDCFSMTIGNSEFINNSQHGIFINGGSKGIIIDSCFINNNDNDGIRINGTTSNCNILDSVIIYNNQEGIVTETVDYILIDSCSVRRNGSNGIDTNGSNEIITACLSSENGGDGIQCGDRTVVSGCNVHDNAGIGVSLNFDDNCSIVGNVVHDNTGNGIQVSGTGGDYNTISANQVLDNGGTGILIDTSSQNDNIITANVVTGNTTAQITDNGTNTIQAHNSGDADSPHGHSNLTELDLITDAGSGLIITSTERTKLDGIETAATADQSDAEIETAYNNQVGIVSQGDAEAGTSTTPERWTPQRVAQAIAALESGGGTTFPVYSFMADQMDSPHHSDWTVNNNAPADSDNDNRGLTIRRFDDDNEEGVGIIFRSPVGATSINIATISRPRTGAASNLDVSRTAYVREIPDAAAVESWSAGTDLATITMGTSNEFFQYDEETITFATLGMVADRITQIELTRDAGNVADTLSGDWHLLQILISFS